MIWASAPASKSAPTPTSPAPAGKQAPSGKLDPEIVDYFKSHGLPEPSALGLAAAVAAESGNRTTAKNSDSGAFGLGQLLGSRKEKFLSQYGPSTSKKDQLDFMLGEVMGGDRGGKSILEAKDPHSALLAAVTKFFRPAAGYETERDISSGEGALRKGYAFGGGPSYDDPSYDASTDTGLADPSLTDPTLDPHNKYRDPRWDAQTATDLGTMPAPPPASASGPPPAPAAQPDLPVGAQASPDTNSGYEPRGKFFDRLKSGKPDAVLSLLSGLSAAATANTRNPLYALASGLGAGAQAYQGQREFGLEREQADTNRYQTLGGIYGQQRAALQSMYHWNPNLLNPKTGQYTGMYVGPGGNVSPDEYAQRIASTFPNVPASGAGGAGLGFNPKALYQPDTPTPAPAPAPSQIGLGVVPNAGQTSPTPTAKIDNPPAALPAASPVAARPYGSDAYRQRSGAVPPTDVASAGVPDNYNPYKLQAQAAALNAQADAHPENPTIQGQLRAQAEAYKTQAASIFKGDTPVVWTDPNGQPHKYTGFYDYAQRMGQTENDIKENQSRAQKQYEDASKFPNLYSTSQLALDDISKASRGVEVQGRSGVWGGLGSALASVPYIGKNIAPDTLKDVNAASDTIKKAQTLVALGNALQLEVGARATGTTEKLLTGNGSDLSAPGARYGAVVRTKALFDQENDYQKALQKAHSQYGGDFTDIDGFNRDFYRSHPVQNYYAKAVRSEPFYNGMGKDDAAQYASMFPKYQKGAKYKDGQRVNVNGQPAIYKGGKIYGW